MVSSRGRYPTKGRREIRKEDKSRGNANEGACRWVAALAADLQVFEHTGHLLSSCELARRYGFTDYDGRRPDWGKLSIDWSVMPPPLVELFRTGTALQLAWLNILADRTRRFRDKMPPS